MSTSDSTQYAVVADRFMLPLDDATTLLKLIAKAKLVSRRYSGDVPYKPSDFFSGSEYTLVLLTTAQHAAVCLEE